MIGPGVAGSSFVAYASNFYSGLAGQLVARIEDSDGNVVVPASTDNIIEIDAGGLMSVYRLVGTYPPVGNYVVIWEDPDGVQAAEDMTVAVEAAAGGSSSDSGPCQAWISADDLVACAGEASSGSTLLAEAAVIATELLYEVSGRQWRGICAATVRPCTSRACGFQTLSRGHIVSGWQDDLFRWSWDDSSPSRHCGCEPLSIVTLAGYPVRTIVAVKIDGELVDPSLYRLDDRRDLVRLADPDGTARRWPACQRLDLPAGAPGTFEVTYLYGADPPHAGVKAAEQLACELVRADPAVEGDCTLPAGTTQVTRQGLTIQRDPLATYISGGHTGLVFIDAFVSTYNPKSQRRGTAVWSPDLQPFPQKM